MYAKSHPEFLLGFCFCPNCKLTQLRTKRTLHIHVYTFCMTIPSILEPCLGHKDLCEIKKIHVVSPSSGILLGSRARLDRLVARFLKVIYM